jgi:NAD(P)-dependent dehydrogenase (short-subunit alcohol dehydrogenase family)
MDLGLDDKVALVTGAWRGTGRGIATVLAEEGARVWLHGFEAEPAEREAAALRAEAASFAQRAAGERRPSGLDVRAVAGDITSDAGAAQVCEAVLRGDRRVDVLVNNYGVAEGPGWLDGTSDDWIQSYQRNVLAGVRLVRGLVPGMRERRFGRVIFVGTVGSLRPGARTPHYYAAKAALPNLTVGLAKELAGTGITVNTVSPGIIATDEVRERFRRTAAKRGWTGDDVEIERRAVADFMPNPSTRAGRVEEVGALVAFLASRHAGYINGANLRIDGGAADVAV